MRKVIVKCKLKNHEGFKKKLTDIEFKFSDVFWQHDRIYVPRNYKPHANFPRLVMRTEMQSVDKPAKYFFLLRRHIEDSGVDMIEETVIKDYETMVNIILQLGFKPIAEVSRRRQTLKMGEGNYIYVDKVEGKPGYYAKIESDLAPNDSVVAAKDDLKKTFATLGETNLVESTYFEL